MSPGRKIRVCFVAEHPSSGKIGGAEVAVSILADRLAEQGVGVHYVCMRRPTTQLECIKFHPLPGWSRTIQSVVNRYGLSRKRRRRIPAGPIGRADVATKKTRIAGMSSKVRSVLHGIYARGYETALSDADADVYIQVCAGAPTGYVADFCREKGKPFIFRSTCLWDADLTFRRGFTDWRDDTKRLYLQGVKQADVVAANSMDTARAFREHVDKDRVRFMPDGFHVLPCLDPSRKDGYVLWVARDAPYKRAWLYVDLARMLPKHEFVMVGDVHEIKNPPSNLRVLGLRKPSELPEIYSSAKVLVSTSEVEGFPNVLVEAAMHGIPYVGFLDPDSVVTEHVLGFQARDLSEMAKRVDILMTNETLRLRLGKNARRFAEEHRDIEKVVRKWLALLEEVAYEKG